MRAHSSILTVSCAHSFGGLGSGKSVVLGQITADRNRGALLRAPLGISRLESRQMGSRMGVLRACLLSELWVVPEMDPYKGVGRVWYVWGGPLTGSSPQVVGL